MGGLLYFNQQPMHVEKPRQRTKKKKEITLMTLLAFEATDESRALLKKHNRQDAVNHIDLEKKLEALWVKSNETERLTVEKEMAEIHPHKKWLFNTLSPQSPSEGTAETTIMDIANEAKSGADGKKEEKKSCCGCMGFNGERQSGFDGKEPFPGVQKSHVELIALVAVIGLTFYFIKNK